MFTEVRSINSESYFFRQSINATCMEDFEENLIQFLADSSSVQYGADGTPFISHERQLVERINSIKIEVYPNEPVSYTHLTLPTILLV